MTEVPIATCAYCPGFEVVCVSDSHRQKVQDAHADKWHAELPPATDELCEQLIGTHANEFDVVVLAIETTAARHHGRVDPNEVRSILPRGITPQVVGATYNVLRRRGRLVPVERGVNNDTHGRNAGKPMTIYDLVGSERTQTA